MRILVTGGSGFFGKSFMQKMMNGDHLVLALSRDAVAWEEKNNSPNIKWITGSLNLTAEAFDQVKSFAPEVIIDLAWEKIPDFSFETCLQNLQNQLSFFNNLFQLPSVKKVIVAGSCWEYNKNIGECSEMDNYSSKDYFTWAKNTLRDFLQFECLRRNINLAWVRIFYIYGPDQRSGSLIPSIIRALLDEKVPSLKCPSNANDFIYADDVAEGFIKLIEQDIVSGVFNLGSGKSTPVIDILRIIEKNIWNDDHITKTVLQNSKDSIQEINFHANMEKTFKDLNWQPATSLEEGIRKTINSYKKNSEA
uniref:NAD-dependent epimerase/dehydratase family protein n=1 Tax=Algoriphagus sp. TaxID=1872435 RepID=UPI0040483C8F